MRGKILVTGASGLLGANLLMEAVKAGHDVIAVSNKHRIYIDGVKSLELDLAVGTNANDLVEEVEPDWIVNCAALTNVDLCEEDPHAAYSMNVKIPIALAKSAHRVGSAMIHISTDSVFDGRRGDYWENDNVNPLNTYAMSKLIAEREVTAEMPEALIIRTNLYGWNMQSKSSFGEWILDKLSTGQQVPAFNDVIFSPLLANHLATIILEMLSMNAVGLYHVASSDSCSKYEFAKRVATMFGFDANLVLPVSLDSANLTATRPKNTSLRTDGIERGLGIRMPDIDSGIRHFCDLGSSGFAKQLKEYSRDKN